MDNRYVSSGAKTPKTLPLTIMAICYAGIIVSIGLFEYLCVQLEQIDLCGFLRIDYGGLNAHDIIFFLMNISLVVVAIITNKRCRFNGWLMLAAMCTFCYASYWQFQCSYFWAFESKSWSTFADLYVHSYLPLTLLAAYGMALLPLLWKRNVWSIVIAVAVAVTMFLQRVMLFVIEPPVDEYCDAWWQVYDYCQYSFGYLLFYNLMPVLISLLLFYVLARDAAMSSGGVKAEQVDGGVSQKSVTPVAPMYVSYCRNCGKGQVEASEFCMNCGVRAGVGDKYCRVCGAKPDPLAEICVKCKNMLK